MNKREMYEASGLKQEKRTENRHFWKEVLCFWTPPIGHLYKHRRCLYCGKEEQMF